MKPFDPNHSRCSFPRYGAIVDDAMRRRNLSSADVARHLGVDQSGPAGWRRGFGRNDLSRTAQFEALLGVKLDFSEPKPSAKAAYVNAATTIAAPSDPVLPHLEAIAMAHGYSVTFAPL